MNDERPDSGPENQQPEQHPEQHPQQSAPQSPYQPRPFEPRWDETAGVGPRYDSPYLPTGQAEQTAPYGQATPTTPLPPPYTGPLGSTAGSTATMTRPPRSTARGRRVFGATVVAAALVVGGGAGIGGAALYSNHHDGGSGFLGSTGTVSQVVNESQAPAADGSVESVASKVLPSVVKLDVSGPQESGSGSGIILSSDGLILTNNHVAQVAENGGSITVSFNDGSHAVATIVGTDPLTDVALVQAKGVSGLTPASIGNSDKLEVGQGVVAIGSPFGLNATVTSGIVSALDRPVDVGSDGNGNTTTYPAIQTDAAINPGNSGGPLVDLNGNVVGINASIQSTSGGDSSSQAGSIGLGFAIPIDEVLPIIDQLKSGETPTHARLGVSVRDAVDDQGAQITDGAQIEDVTAGSVAKQAGLANGDVITKVDSDEITSADSLVATIRSFRPGDQVQVTYERDGQSHTTTVTLGTDAGSATS